MNIEDPAPAQNNSFNLCETASKIVQPCIGFLSNFTFGHPIHPLEPVAPQFSEYLVLNRRRRLRIIHVKPNFTIKEEHRSSNLESKIRTSRSSLSEEYWFTRWNRPLKLGNCNCSFRRSQRFSALSDQRLPLSVYNPTNNIPKPNSICMSDICNSNLSNYDIPPIKIVNVETFVERLIQDTLFEAFQEFFMKESLQKDSVNCNVATSGVTNFGFIKSENEFRDEFDGVILRHPLKVLNEHDSVLEEEKQQSSSKNIYNRECRSSTGRSSCVHGTGSRGQTKRVCRNIFNLICFNNFIYIISDIFIYNKI